VSSSTGLILLAVLLIVALLANAYTAYQVSQLQTTVNVLKSNQVNATMIQGIQDNVTKIVNIMTGVNP